MRPERKDIYKKSESEKNTSELREKRHKNRSIKHRDVGYYKGRKTRKHILAAHI